MSGAAAAKTGMNTRPATPKVVLGMDGLCPVSITKDRDWKQGQSTFGCIHRGRLYYFLSKEYKDLFLAEPDRYAPVLAGYDVVEYIDNGRLVEGKTEHVLMPKTLNRLMRFSSDANKKKLMSNPARYYQAVEVARQNIDTKFLR